MNEGKSYEEFDDIDREELKLLEDNPEAFAMSQAEEEADMKFWEEETPKIFAEIKASEPPRPSPWQRAKACLLSLFA